MGTASPGLPVLWLQLASASGLDQQESEGEGREKSGERFSNSPYTAAPYAG